MGPDMARSFSTESFPAPVRYLITAIFGATFITLFFGVFPASLAELNNELGWPRWQPPAQQALGVTLFAASLGLVLYCSRLFWRLGKGTPVPIQPPTVFVASGLYRFSRNPMYVGQVGVQLSYFCFSGELTLLLYAFAWAASVQAFILGYEEPDLRARFGASYEEYCRTVPRWLALHPRG